MTNSVICKISQYVSFAIYYLILKISLCIISVMIKIKSTFEQIFLILLKESGLRY